MQALNRFLEKLRTYPRVHAIRGATVGIFWAFTPTIGIQIPLIVGLWTVVHKRWPFSLSIAIACTFVTNVFTMTPVYYLFIVTGRFMLGQMEEDRGFEVFNERLEGSLHPEEPFWSSFISDLFTILETFGLPLFLGSLPWACLMAVLTWVTLSYLLRHHD